MTSLAPIAMLAYVTFAPQDPVYIRQTDAERLAQVAAGEAHWPEGFYAVMCTMFNRYVELNNDAGAVLEAYYAPPKPLDEIPDGRLDIVWAIFNRSLACHPDAWYAISRADKEKGFSHGYALWTTWSPPLTPSGYQYAVEIRARRTARRRP